MKKASYIILGVTLVVVVVLILSPESLGRSTNPCSRPGCHSSYNQYLDILEGNSANQIPTAINVSETKSVSVVIENINNAPQYTSLSSVSVTLSSQNGHFSIKNPTYDIGDLPVGKGTATWQITGVSDGYDWLVITAQAENPHFNVPFSDDYSPLPLITVGSPTGTPPPSPTPPPTPTPASTPPPTSTTPTPTPPQSPTPSSTPAPVASPNETETASPSQLSIHLTAPLDGEQWSVGITHSINWTTDGGADPLIVALEYSTVDTAGPWTAIATDLPSNGSIIWETPNVASKIYIRASVTNSENPPETASTLTSVEVTGANSEIPLLLIHATLILTVSFLIFLFVRMRRKRNTADGFLKEPVKSMFTAVLRDYYC